MITFNIEGIDMPAINPEEVTRWVEQVAASYGRTVGDINYVFVNDERILEVNRQFLGHDYYTDIITFCYNEQHIISGDLYISLDTVASNAQQVGTTYEQELHRVIIHGVLHLCGINDKGPGEREIMEAAENKALAENFVETSTPGHPSKFDIGPVNTMITRNFIDGYRFRLSGQTTANLSPHLFASGYVAYGLDSKKVYYKGDLT